MSTPQSSDEKPQDALWQTIERYITYCTSEGLSEQSVKIYSSSLDYFYRWCQGEARINLDPKTVTPDNIIAYIAYLKTPQKERWGRKVKKNSAKLSLASVNTYFRSLKVFFNYLELVGIIEKTPINRKQKIFNKKEPLPTKYQKNMSGEQLEKLFDYLRQPELLKKYNGCRNLGMVSLLLDSGMRRGELLSIRVGDFDWINKTVRINGKTGPRLCMFGGADQALCDYRDKHRVFQEKYKSSDSPFWLTSDGHPLTINGLQTLMIVLAKESGVSFSAHKLRHSYASFMVQRTDIYNVSKLLGHSSIKITELYLHNSDARMQQIYKNNSPLAIMGIGQPTIKLRRGRPKGARNIKHDDGD